MDQRRNSGFSRNTKLASIHHHTSEKVLQQQISSLEDRFSKDTKRLRKETQDIKKDFYALQKQKRNSKYQFYVKVRGKALEFRIDLLETRDLGVMTLPCLKRKMRAVTKTVKRF